MGTLSALGRPEVPPEINVRGKPTVLFVGRDPGDNEVRKGAPFVGWSGERLTEALTAAGLKRSAVNIANVVPWQPKDNEFAHHPRAAVEAGTEALRGLITELRPSLIVTMGNEASYACIAGWPSSTADIYGATGIGDRRGYIWPYRYDGALRVLSTLHPAGTHPRRDPAGHAGVLLMKDIERAAEVHRGRAVVWPQRTVRVVRTQADAAEVCARLAAAPLVACDIETEGTSTLSCIGFAASTDLAYVFTPGAFPYAFELLAGGSARFVFQNGQYDLYFLLSRCGIRVAGYVDDTIVAWHSLYPELAGAAEGPRRGKAGRRTRKSLAFLASIYTYVPWWKDYDFETDHQRYTLCGRDCCTTLEIMQHLRTELAEERLEPIYRTTLERIWPAVEMQRRGLLVDDAKRRECISELAKQRQAAIAELCTLAEPLLAEARADGRLAKPHLIWEKVTCRCCRGASKKLARCWSCAGFEAAPGKGELVEYARKRIALARLSPSYALARIQELTALRKADLEDSWLLPCAACGGRGKWESYAFNPSSPDQVSDLLYNALKMPDRASTDEGALKSLLGWLRGEDDQWLTR